MYPNVHSKATVQIEILEDVVGLETHELEDIKCLKICMIDIHKTSTTQNTEKHTVYVQIQKFYTRNWGKKTPQSFCVKI
jgi:hypothetical protein